MTNSQKIGSVSLIFIFIVISSPVALSPEDPYHLQEYSEKLNFLLVFEKLFSPDGLNHSNDFVVIDGIKYRVFFDGELDIKNFDNKKYLIPGVDGILASKGL